MARARMMPGTMRQAERIVDQMERAFRGSPWYGPAAQRVLGGVTAAQASARPIAGAHSIWELVLHMTGWKVEAARSWRRRGSSSGTTSGAAPNNGRGVISLPVTG